MHMMAWLIRYVAYLMNNVAENEFGSTKQGEMRRKSGRLSADITCRKDRAENL